MKFIGLKFKQIAVGLMYLLIGFTSSVFAGPTQIDFKIASSIEADLNHGINLFQINPESQIEKSLLEKHFLVKPTTESSVVISNIELSRKIRPMIAQIEQETGIKVHVQIPSSLVITTPRKPIDKKVVRDLLMKQFVVPCADCNYVIEELDLPTIPQRLQGQDWQVRLVNASPRGQFNFEIFQPQSNSKKTWGNTKFWGSGFARLEGKVAVLVTNKVSGDTVSDQDLTWEIRNLTFTRGAPVQLNFLKGSVLKVAKNASDILWTDEFSKKLVIKKNETVKVTIGEKDWQISITAIAQSNGHVGDKIEVMNTSSKKMFTAEVTGEGNVKVE